VNADADVGAASGAGFSCGMNALAMAIVNWDMLTMAASSRRS
jgi:hypothetical protein